MSGNIVVVTSWDGEGGQLPSLGWKPERQSSAEVEFSSVPGTQ